MKLLLKRIMVLSFVSTLYLASQPTSSAASAAPDQQNTQLQKIQDYLNRIVTLRANFSQRNPNGTIDTGQMYLKRLGRESFGKMRLQYNPPAKIKIIANGETLRHEDAQTQDVSEYSIDSTPASFLLRHKIDFFNDLVVKKMETREENIYLTVTRPDDDGVTITLIFVTSPILRFQGWVVVDAQASTTRVTLSQVEIGIPIADKLFEF